MRQHKYHSRIAVGTIVVVLLAACAGCWQKIEYTGPNLSATRAERASPSAAGEISKGKQVNSVEPGNGSAEAKPPLPGAAEIPRSIAEVDRDPSTAEAPRAPDEQQRSTRHTDATAVSATVEVPRQVESPNTRQAAWILGSRLSRAALAHDRGMATINVPIWLEEARSAAKLLGTSVPDLPEAAAAGDNAPASRQVIDYLVLQGHRIDGELSQRQGPDHAALFEVAWKSNVLVLLYTPGSSVTTSISAAISRAAPQAGLPAELWQPLVELLGKQSSMTDVRAAVRQLHSDVERTLANAAERSGR